MLKPDFTKVSELFYNELQESAKGEKTQLLFVKTYLPQKPIITAGTIQVVVLGGTNYDFAVVEIRENGEKTILLREKGKLPTLNSAEAFTSLLDMHLTTKVDGIALNLGFPLSYFKGEKGQPDGTFIKAIKAHSLHGLLGHKIGEIVLDRYIRKHTAYATVSVANDAVCLAQDDAGLILGTGLNIGIKGEDENGVYVINLEAGNANAYETNQELESIDKQSVNPGIHRFEKLVSGYYLPLHFNLLAKKNAIEVRVTKAEELAELASTNSETAGELARELFDRSAKYVAAQIAGLYTFKDSPEKFVVTAEGSLFHYGYKYQKTLQQGLIELGISNESVTFHTMKDSSLYGALRLLM